MEMRRIGNSALSIAPIVFGGTVLGWTVDERTAFRILDAFVDAGFNAIDTADSYSRAGPGSKGRTDDSEAIIGNWFRANPGRRQRIVLLSKVGREMGPDKKGLSRRYIAEAVEGSLQRLQTDTIDLYQSHRDDPDTPSEETLAAYAALMAQGKVRAIGASNFTAARLREAQSVARACGLPRYECLQPRYNLYERDGFEGELEALCRTEKIGVVAYYGLAGGFLTGKYRSAADCTGGPRASRMPAYLNAKGLRILALLDELSAAHRVGPAAVALAWLIARPSATAPIASVTKVEHVAAFSAAAALKLSKEELRLLDAVGLETPTGLTCG